MLVIICHGVIWSKSQGIRVMPVVSYTCCKGVGYHIRKYRLKINVCTSCNGDSIRLGDMDND